MTNVLVATRDVARFPEFAGNTWVHMQYVLGLQRLGVEILWVDHLGQIDPYKHHHTVDYLFARFDRTAREFGFPDNYRIEYNEGERAGGLSETELREAIVGADLLLAIGGYLPNDSPLLRIKRRAYVDLDPGFTQIWALEKALGFERFDTLFTVGQNVGRPEFTVPLGQFAWHPILPPVVLELWPPRVDEQSRRFSTIGDWRGSQEAIFEDEYYGGKRGEFIRFLRVPQDADERVELALLIGREDHEDLGLLQGHNWRVQNPYLFAGDPQAYQEFIQYSRAEFSVAKSGYVKSMAGWVSDRTACYLASGKPALVQSTGFEGRLPTSKGLLTFRTPEEAVAGIEAINGDYVAHCQAAREIAEQHFDSDTVLGSLLEKMGI